MDVCKIDVDRIKEVYDEMKEGILGYEDDVNGN